MRFVRLVVDRFQGIEHAEVEFGEGLNVLYGPNDIGKSTLAAAMRAVLLLPTGSAEALEYVSWQGDHTPEVQLTFRDVKGIYHRVTKSFGVGARGSARLERSRDGSVFDTDATGRQVEEKLRSLLEWGIPAPGGKSGGKKGLPDAFLSRALLSEQAEVDAILSDSFENDPAESGRLRLSTALQAFAHDPRFKKVLDQAQAKVDDLFTPTGQRKRGKGSPFLAAAEEVKSLQNRLQALQQEKKESELAEARVGTLLTQVRDARDRKEADEEVLREVEERLRMAEARAQAAAEVDLAAAALQSIDDQRALVERKEDEVTELGRRLGELDRVLQDADRQLGKAVDDLAASKEALQRETGDEATLTRALRRTQVEKAIAELDTKRTELQAVKRDAEVAARCSKEVTTLEAERHLRDQECVKGVAKSSAALAAIAEATRELQRLDDLQAYSRWTAAQKALDDALSAATDVQQLDADSAAIEAEVARLRAEAAAITVATVEEVRTLEELEQHLAVAEAALGGGLSVSIRAAPGIAVRLRADGQPAVVTGAGETVEAARTVELSVPDVVDVHVLAGDANARRGADELRRRWNDEAIPMLERGGVGSVRELRTARDTVDELIRTADARAKDHERIEGELGLKRATAAPLEDLRTRAAELESALAGRDRSVLAGLHAGLKRGWESEVEKTRGVIEQRRRQANEDLLEARTTCGHLDGEIAQLDANLTKARDALDEATRKVPDPARQLLAIEAQETDLKEARDRLQSDLANLDQGGNEAAQLARQRVEEKQAAVDAATHARAAAHQDVEDQRSALDRARGEHSALKAAADHLPRETAAKELNAKRAALDALPTPPGATVEERDALRNRLESLKRELESKRDDLSKAEGALAHVGGAVVAERCNEVQSALGDATDRQRVLETDAQAWRLLQEVLHESESAGMKHLGRVLAEDVGRRFQDLTGGRYGTLDLGPNVETLAVQAQGAARSVSALSVGTREQLATLLRLAIAESLGSAIVLDDHLVEADATRLEWFVDVLRRAAEKIQVVVLTCRRRDYEYPDGTGSGRSVAWLDADGAIKRWPQPGPRPSETEVGARSPLSGIQRIASASPVPGTAVSEQPSPGAADDETPFGELLAAALGEMGATTQDCADSLRVGHRIVQLWIQGRSVPAPELRPNVLRFLLEGQVAADAHSARARAAGKLASLDR